MELIQIHKINIGTRYFKKNNLIYIVCFKNHMSYSAIVYITKLNFKLHSPVQYQIINEIILIYICINWILLDLPEIRYLNNIK